MDTLLKPAVRATTDWNAEAITRPPGESAPSVFGLVHSKTAKARAPATHKKTDTQTVTSMCTDHRPTRKR